MYASLRTEEGYRGPITDRNSALVSQRRILVNGVFIDDVRLEVALVRDRFVHWLVMLVNVCASAQACQRRRTELLLGLGHSIVGRCLEVCGGLLKVECLGVSTVRVLVSERILLERVGVSRLRIEEIRVGFMVIVRCMLVLEVRIIRRIAEQVGLDHVVRLSNRLAETLSCSLHRVFIS